MAVQSPSSVDIKSSTSFGDKNGTLKNVFKKFSFTPSVLYTLVKPYDCIFLYQACPK